MFIPLLVLFAAVQAFDCSASDLLDYNFKSLKGVYDAAITRNTPPSTAETTWYFGICENTDSIENCPKNSDICGITKLKFDNKDKPIVSEIISFNVDLNKVVKPLKSEEGVKILYESASWGDVLVDAEVSFRCATLDSKDIDVFKIDSWDGKTIKANVVTKAACVSSKKNKKPSDSPEDDTGESWGWFTWIFIFMVLFLSIYIIGGAWFQYNKGNAIDFQSALKEVLENFIDLLKGLPAFVREIVEKFTGNSNRGEYSAV